MPVTYSENDDLKTVEIVANGHISVEDFDAVAPRMQTFIDRHGTIRLIEIIESLAGFDPSLTWKGMRFDLRNLRHISHVAVVSDVGWISPMAKVAGSFMSTRVRTFDLDEIDEARAWLADP